MHPLTPFFEEKLKLDQAAIAHGRSCALPIEVMPRLRAALEDCVQNKAGRFPGTEEQLDYLGNAARIMAIFAVWDSSKQWIESGLLALVFENAQSDSRVTLTHFAMLNHAAKKIGADFDQMARTLIDQLGPDLTEWLSAFVARIEERRAIEAFGYREVVRGGKFDFKNVM